MDYENHLSILPVDLKPLDNMEKSDKEIYRYNIYSGKVAKREEDMPVAYFRYKLNPVSIKYEEVKKSFYHFIV